MAACIAFLFLSLPRAAASPIEPQGEAETWQVALVAKPNHLADKPPPVPRTPNKPATSTVRAFVTGYNTVPGQTDSTPCTAAGGNICGRTDVVACPTYLALHSHVEIRGKVYECMDRTAPKFNSRFDISCDKDVACALRQTGWEDVRILGS